MIQSPALSPAAMLGLPGEGATASNGYIAPGADFGALLAVTVPVPVAENAPDEAAPATALAPVTITSEPAIPATTGKILPLALPPQTAEPQATPELAATPLALNAPLVVALPRTKSAPPKEASVSQKVARGEHKKTDIVADGSATAPSPKTAAAAVVEPDPAVTPLPAQPEAAVNLVLAQPDPGQAQPAPLKVAAKPELAATAIPTPTLPQLSTAAPQAAAPTHPDRPALSPQPQGQAAFEHAAPQAAFLRALAGPSEPHPKAEQTPAQPNTPAPIRSLRIEIALPEQVNSIIRAVRPVASRLLARIEPDILTAPVFSASISAPPTFSQSAVQPTSLERPQDFTALLDRLVAARDAAAPQRISVTLPHADFGPVHLRFRQEDGALAVTMTSADPEFARAAAQAAPPVLPAAEARGVSGSASYTSNPANASGTGPGQQRGQSADQRSEHSLTTNPPPLSAGPEKSARRHGIFA